MSRHNQVEFESFAAPIVKMKVTHIWRGVGSAIFLEMGNLTPRIRRDGSPGNGRGEMGLMIEWSWRIEDDTHILGGSWSDEEEWPELFRQLLGTHVSDISLFARLPEIQLKFSNGLYLCSMMTANGDPEWALFDRRKGGTKSVGVRSGKLHFENEASEAQV
jgi:hypothetical protein